MAVLTITASKWAAVPTVQEIIHLEVIQEATHPFKIHEWKELWCLFHTWFLAWLHWKHSPGGTMLGTFLKQAFQSLMQTDEPGIRCGWSGPKGPDSKWQQFFIQAEEIYFRYKRCWKSYIFLLFGDNLGALLWKLPWEIYSPLANLHSSDS